MKTYLAVFIGTEDAMARARWTELPDEVRKAREQDGMKAWQAWAETHAAAVVEPGAPLGRTKRVAPEGIADIRNVMAGYVVVRAASHEAAAAMFLDHPHFTIFPGDSVEVMECLPMPG
jgi:hypothetical protein